MEKQLRNKNAQFQRAADAYNRYLERNRDGNEEEPQPGEFQQNGQRHEMSFDFLQNVSANGLIMQCDDDEEIPVINQGEQQRNDTQSYYGEGEDYPVHLPANDLTIDLMDMTPTPQPPLISNPDFQSIVVGESGSSYAQL